MTNVRRIRRGISETAENAVLIKLNQIGTLTEAIAAIRMAHKAGWIAMISHRTGESEETMIADLAVAAEPDRSRPVRPAEGSGRPSITGSWLLKTGWAATHCTWYSE